MNKELGITVLIVEQYLEFVLEISDYIYMMEKGNIVMQGKTGELDALQIQKAMTD